jgi:hypothetical protein
MVSDSSELDFATQAKIAVISDVYAVTLTQEGKAQ